MELQQGIGSTASLILGRNLLTESIMNFKHTKIHGCYKWPEIYFKQDRALAHNSGDVTAFYT